MIDTHTHISDKVFDNSRDEIIQSLKNYGIKKIIETSYDLDTIKKSLSLSNKYEFIYSTLGIHPSEADNNQEEAYDIIIKEGQNKKVVSIGEIGLDYHYSGYDKRKQENVFKEQIEIADNLNLSITLHIRDAYQDSLKILNDMKKYIHNGIYIHCYGGSCELVKEYKKFDAMFGFDGPITYKNFKQIPTIKEVGIDNIFTETDCPYLTPEPFRGKVNEPKNVLIIQKKLSEIFALDFEELQFKIWNNAHRFFKRLND